ncbi:MAG: ATP-dependent Clp protease adaptor ClpS [Bacteroidota bacterium]
MTAKETKRQNLFDEDALQSEIRNLILHNDDVHTFDYVIDALMEICDHEYIQASQCAIITHYKGKCDIKQGVFSSLKVMKDALTQKELTTTID